MIYNFVSKIVYFIR